MSTNPPLQLVEKKAELHADDEAGHAQEYVAPQLTQVNTYSTDTGLTAILSVNPPGKPAARLQGDHSLTFL